MWFLKYSKEAHKHACLSLYKALLTHAAHLPLDTKRKTTAAIIIRRKFRKSKNLQGGPCRKALKSAYDDEALLRRACQNDAPSISAIQKRLGNLKFEHAQKVVSTFMPKKVVVKPPTPPSQLAPKRKKKILALTMTPREKAIRSARIRARPPVMGCTNGLPLLKRPGRRGPPQWVCAIINNKIKSIQRQVNAVNNVKDNLFYYAEMEDAWDEVIRHHNKEEREAVTWTDGADDALISLRGAYHEKERKTYELTSRFQGIIDQATVQFRVDLRNARVLRRASLKQRLIKEKETKLAEIRKEWQDTKGQRVPTLRPSVGVYRGRDVDSYSARQNHQSTE